MKTILTFAALGLFAIAIPPASFAAPDDATDQDEVHRNGVPVRPVPPPETDQQEPRMRRHPTGPGPADLPRTIDLRDDHRRRDSRARGGAGSGGGLGAD